MWVTPSLILYVGKRYFSWHFLQQEGGSKVPAQLPFKFI